MKHYLAPGSGDQVSGREAARCRIGVALAPLGHEDVRIAAAANGWDGDLFLRAVAEKMRVAEWSRSNWHRDSVHGVGRLAGANVQPPGCSRGPEGLL
jgi:hypothetical protein